MDERAAPLPELALWGTEIGLWDWSVPDDRLTWINNWCEQSGLREYAGRDHERLWTARMHPDDFPDYQALLAEHMTGRSGVFNVEYRLRDRADNWVWIQERGRVVERDAAGRALRMVGVCLATDERHRALHALERSEARFELAIRGTDFGFWDIDVESDEIHWWNDWCSRFDIDPVEGPGHAARWDARVHPDDLPRMSGYEALISGGSALFEAEYRIRTRGGAWRWLLSRARATQRDASGRVLRLTGISIDIDARKRAELALVESEARLEAAVWGTDIGLWESNGEGHFRWFNDWCTPLDIDPCEGVNQLQRWRERLHPEDLPLFDRAHNETIAGIADLYAIEYRVLTHANRWRWLHDRCRVTARHADGRASRIVGVCLDIDARKRMEIALRDSETRLETAIWGSDLGLWDWNLKSDTMVWLSDWPARFGIGVPAAAGPRSEWLARLHPSDRDRLRDDDVAMMHAGRDSGEHDYQFRDAQGSWRWVNVRTRVIARDPAGRAERIVGACIDVDGRRRAEQLLRTQALIVETMREGVILIAADGRVEFTNPAFDAMFGWRAGELIGTAALALLNLRNGSRAQPVAVARLLRRFNARSNKRHVWFRRRDGSQFAGEVLSAGIEQNGAKKILVVVQDVSERKRLEGEITEAASRERRRLASDLHDGLGQELTGISLLLRSFAKQLGTDEQELSPQLDGIITLVNRAIQTTRTIAMGLSLAATARDGFVAALTSLASWSHAHFGIDVQLRLAVAPQLRVEEFTASHLYLIAQEAILNAVKHGRAQSVVVSLRVAEQMLSLSVADDGVGLPVNYSGASGMGLKIMEYRAGMIGGTVHIKNRKSGGVRVRCLCPLARHRKKAVKDPAGNAVGKNGARNAGRTAKLAAAQRAGPAT